MAERFGPKNRVSAFSDTLKYVRSCFSAEDNHLEKGYPIANMNQKQKNSVLQFVLKISFESFIDKLDLKNTSLGLRNFSDAYLGKNSDHRLVPGFISPNELFKKQHNMYPFEPVELMCHPYAKKERFKGVEKRWQDWQKATLVNDLINQLQKRMSVKILVDPGLLEKP